MYTWCWELSSREKERVNDKSLGAAACICIALAPVTLGLSLLLLFGLFCVASITSQAHEKRIILNEAMIRSCRFESDEQDLLEEIHSAYILPSHCHVCGAEIIVSKLKWMDGNVALCPHCESVLRAIVV